MKKTMRQYSQYEEAKVKPQKAKVMKAQMDEDNHLIKHGPMWAETSQLGMKKKVKKKVL